jgi:hypothetical protein
MRKTEKAYDDRRNIMCLVFYLALDNLNFVDFEKEVKGPSSYTRVRRIVFVSASYPCWRALISMETANCRLAVSISFLDVSEIRRPLAILTEWMTKFGSDA